MSNTAAKRHFVPMLAFFVLAIVVGVIARDVLSFEALSENRARLLMLRDANYPLAVGLFILGYIAIVALSLPGATVATLAGGFLFGLFPGVVFNITGACIGASLLFLAARWGVGDWFVDKIDASDGRIHEVKQRLDRNQWSALFLMRLLPVVPFFLANLLPAFLGVPFHRYVISTALGIVPGAVVYTSVGAGLSTVFETGEAPDLAVIFAPHVLGPILGLCLLALLPMLWKARQK